jgi:hypothetical protein
VSTSGNDTDSSGSNGVAEARKPIDFAKLWIPILLTAAGSALRVWTATRSGVYRDEGQFIWVVRFPSWREMINFLQIHESHPPLYYIVTRLTFYIFGDSERSALLIPLIFGAASIPAIFYVGSRMFDWKVGTIAATFAAFAPILVEYSAYVRPYSLLHFCCLTSVYSLWKLLSDRRFSSGLLYVLSTLAMTLTHNWSFLILIGEWTAVLCVFAGRELKKIEWRRDAWNWLSAQAAIAAFYAPWLPTLIGQTLHAGYGRSVVPYKPVELFVRSFLIAILLDVGLFTYAVILSVAGFALVRRLVEIRVESAYASPTKSSDRLGERLLLGVPAAALIAAVALTPFSTLLFIYCISIVGPCLLLWFANLLEKSFRGRLIVLKYAVIALVLIQYARHDAALSRVILKSNDREAAAAVTAAGPGPDDFILVQPQWNAASFFYYYPFHSNRLDYPIEPFFGPVYYDRGIVDLLSDEARFDRFLARIEKARSDGKKIWLILDESKLPGIESPDDTITANAIREGFPKLYSIRSKQIYQNLTRLYGEPRVIFRSDHKIHSRTYENVYLFSVSSGLNPL